MSVLGPLFRRSLHFLVKCALYYKKPPLTRLAEGTLTHPQLPLRAPAGPGSEAGPGWHGVRGRARLARGHRPTGGAGICQWTLGTKVHSRLDQTENGGCGQAPKHRRDPRVCGSGPSTPSSPKLGAGAWACLVSLPAERFTSHRRHVDFCGSVVGPLRSRKSKQKWRLWPVTLVWGRQWAQPVWSVAVGDLEMIAESSWWEARHPPHGAERRAGDSQRQVSSHGHPGGTWGAPGSGPGRCTPEAPTLTLCFPVAAKHLRGGRGILRMERLKTKSREVNGGSPPPVWVRGRFGKWEQRGGTEGPLAGSEPGWGPCRRRPSLSPGPAER